MLKFLSLPAAALLLIAGPALAAPDDTVATPEKPARTSSAVPRGLMRYDTNKDGAVDRAEWKAGPLKLSRPGMSGIVGRFNWPTALTNAENDSLPSPSGA